MALKLTIGTLTGSMSIGGTTVDTATYTYTDSKTKKKTSYTMTLLELSFCKQMYRPGQINARIQISTLGTNMSVSAINTLFTDAKVTLTDDSNNSIASDYYVADVIGEKIGGFTYTRLTIYSIDKQMDITRENNVFTAKKLITDILTTKAGKISLPYDSTTFLSSKISSKLTNQLKNGSSEYKLPYTVQFDETFYDMLCRIANRWGEFVYFEGGNLIIGRKAGDKYTMGSGILDKNVIYSIITNPERKCEDIVSEKAYLETIEKDNYLKRAGDMFAFDAFYQHKFIQSFLNMKTNICDWAVDRAFDDTIAAAQNTAYLNAMQKKYNDTYFTGSDTKIAQFADLISGLTAENYQAILKNEQTAGKETLCIDLGATYKHIKLGDIIAANNSNYLVTKVECLMEEDPQLKIVTIKKGDKDSVTEVKRGKRFRFRVYAIPEVSSAFYPPVLPSGHARIVGPQFAIVVDTFDPRMDARYRIKFDWQGTDTNYSPWIPVAHQMFANGCGSVWKIEKDSVVLLNFKDGNIERPYIVGAIQTKDIKAPISVFSNTMDMTTLAGHAMRMTDGYGGGALRFAAQMHPITSFINGFFPDKGNNDNDPCSKFYEGGVELTDKFGIYRIVGSTDERKVTLQSPYGDQKISAFTGITISSPNGDVNIQGKNISIEAGNNITIESGKNIDNAILGSGYQAGGIKASAEGFGGAVTGAIRKKISGLTDMSALRTGLEILLRPVDGTLKIKSNRYLLFEAGNGEATIRSDRYQVGQAPGMYNNMQAYAGLLGAIDVINIHVDEVINTIKEKKKALEDAKSAYETARAAVTDGELTNAFKSTTAGENQCLKILTEVYNTKNPQKKTYQDGDFLANPANPLTTVQKAMRAAVEAYADAAYEYYNYIKQHAIDDTMSTFFGKGYIKYIASDPKTIYYNEVATQAVAAKGTAPNEFIHMDLFDPNVALRDDVLNAIGLLAKRAWFKAVFDAVKAAAIGTYQFDNTQAYNNPADWNTYVNGFSETANGPVSLGTKLRNALKEDFMKLVSAVLLEDRYRWKAGKGGQIIFSDMPDKSIVFNADGTPDMYINISSSDDKTGVAELKRRLHEWD